MRDARLVVACASLLAVALSSKPALAGWTLTNSGIGQTKGIFDLSTPDPSACYAVGIHDTGSGDQATIWVTTNGGGSWDMKSPSTSPMAMYVSVFAPTPTKAYVGSMRYIFITTDGGLGWTQTGDAGALTMVSGVGGYGENLVVAVTSSGAIFRSDTGGASWAAVDNPISDPLAKVWFLDETHGWLLGNSYDGDTGVYSDGALLRTTDGGLTWDVMFSGEARGIQAVSFINPYEGWLVSVSASGPTFEKTADGGATWTMLDVPTYTEGPVNDLWDVEFFDRCEGWLIVATGEDQVTSSLFYTSNAGESWTEWGMDWAIVPIPFPITLRGQPITMDFSDRSNGYTGGFYEILGRYTGELPDPGCGGTNPDSWTDPERPEGYDYYGDSGCGCSMVR